MFKKNNSKFQNLDEFSLAVKMFVIIFYLIVITILFVCTYTVYKNTEAILPWDEAKSVNDYTYIEISKMSEKFAFYSEKNIGIHFVIEKEETGRWHTYLVAINEADYDKFKDIIDYSYDRTSTIPEPIKVYGYPVNIDETIKNLAIKDINNFLPSENEVTITKDNYETYLTNSYLDTTIARKKDINPLLITTIFLLVVFLIQLFLTLINKDRIVPILTKKLTLFKKRHPLKNK